MKEGRAKVACAVLFQPAGESVEKCESVTTHLFPQNLCHTQNGLFSVSLSNLLSNSLSEADSVNFIPNQVLALFVEFIVLVPSHNNDNMVKLGRITLFCKLGKQTKKYQSM